MRRLLALLLAPLLMATQCEDDFDNSGFETSYIIQNDSNTVLFLLNREESFIEIQRRSELSFGSDLNSETNPIAPSESLVFDEIKLYKKENENFIFVYGQSPLEDTTWMLDEPVMNRYEYRLVITDVLIE
ncbi:hypothetical protein [uncultured Croceitalea sp.]|uniref:hypothetical protein n=1 Tax=uncultured Croceitalea sp. TaxID=1798908 RepID=UPI0033062C8B